MIEEHGGRSGIKYRMDQDQANYLEKIGFNEEQIMFIDEQINNYMHQKEDEYFDYDSYERDMWFVMNRSGLFERDEDNKTDIFDWGPNETRSYITEIR